MNEVPELFEQIAGVLLSESAVLSVSGEQASCIRTATAPFFYNAPTTIATQVSKELTEYQVFDIIDPVYTVQSTKSTQICKHFQEGNCMLGDSCPYIHKLK